MDATGPATQNPIRAVSAGESHVGTVRSCNAMLIRDDAGLWAVADGMGGHSRGDFASRTVVEHLTAARATMRPRDLLREVVDRAAEANGVLRREAAAIGAEAIGSTLVAFLATAGAGVFAWIGDSRGYLLRDGMLRQITRDHSVVQALVERGALAPEEAESHPHAHVLTRAIGAADDAEFDFEQFRLARGDRVLLCSDGLTRAVPDPELERALAQAPAPEAAVRAMIEAALAAGAQDNVTAVAVFFE